MNNIQNLQVDLDLKQNLNIYATCKQLDNLNLICTIYNDSVQADLSNYNVRLKAMKADNVPLIQEHVGISILTNVATIEAHDQLTTTSGKTLIELQFIDKTTGKKKATFNLVLIVVPSTLEVDRTISTATYTLLEELENKLDQAGDYLQNIDQAIELNSELITQNTNATINISSLGTKNTDATKNISNLSAENSKATPNISNLNSANIQAEANIEALEQLGDVTQIAQDVTNVKNEVNNARGSEVNLGARLDKFNTSLSDVAHKNGTLQTNLNSEMIGGKKLSDLMLKAVVYANDVFNSNDMNAFIVGGQYQVKSGTINIPLGDGWGTLDVIGAGDRLMQTFHVWNGDSNVLYTRTLNATIWSGWRQLATTEIIDILFVGDVASGDINLSRNVTDYQKLVVRIDEAGIVSNTIYIYSTNYPNNFGIGETIGAPYSSGSFMFNVKSNTALSVTRDTNNGRILKIYGIKR